jgi:hypothetical protein
MFLDELLLPSLPCIRHSAEYEAFLYIAPAEEESPKGLEPVLLSTYIAVLLLAAFDHQQFKFYSSMVQIAKYLGAENQFKNIVLQCFRNGYHRTINYFIFYSNA